MLKADSAIKDLRVDGKGRGWATPSDLPEMGEKTMREYIVPISDDSSDHDEIFVGYIRKNARELVRCKDCEHNPSRSWFECPMSHLSEAQRPETAWCWKAERRADDED